MRKTHTLKSLGHAFDDLKSKNKSEVKVPQPKHTHSVAKQAARTSPFEPVKSTATTTPRSRPPCKYSRNLATV